MPPASGRPALPVVSGLWRRCSTVRPVEDGGRGRYGAVPLAKVAHVLRTTFGLQVTPGGLAHLLHRTARDAAPTYTALCEQVRNSPVVTPDETGWRVAAISHWLWAFVTPETGLRHLPRRGFDGHHGSGGDFDGVRATGGCRGEPRCTNRHLLRRCKELASGQSLAGQVQAVADGPCVRDRCNDGELRARWRSGPAAHAKPILASGDVVNARAEQGPSVRWQPHPPRPDASSAGRVALGADRPVPSSPTPSGSPRRPPEGGRHRTLARDVKIQPRGRFNCDRRQVSSRAGVKRMRLRRSGQESPTHAISARFVEESLNEYHFAYNLPRLAAIAAHAVTVVIPWRVRFRPHPRPDDRCRRRGRRVDRTGRRARWRPAAARRA